MKIILFFLLFLFLICSSCSHNEDFVMPQEKNQLSMPLDQSLKVQSLINKDTLKILAIGNSFTEDLLSYVPAILRKMNIKNVVLAEVTYPRSSLYEHNLFYYDMLNIYNFYINKGIDSGWDTQRSINLKYAISYTNWDIVIVQQSSNNSGLYSTYQPYLNNLLSIIHNNVVNKNIVFIWHSTWAYASNSSNPAFNNYHRNQIEMYRAIVDTRYKVSNYTGIKWVIPTGEVIQSLRQTTLNNNGMDLTRDGTHLDLNIGRYTASATFIKSVILSCYPSKNQNIPFITLREQTGTLKLTLENYKECLSIIDKTLNIK